MHRMQPFCVELEQLLDNICYQPDICNLIREIRAGHHIDNNPKSDGSPVTALDKAIAGVIWDCCISHAPNEVLLVSEETPHPVTRDIVDARYLLLVDELDGTAALVAGELESCFIMAAMLEKQPDGSYVTLWARAVNPFTYNTISYNQWLPPRPVRVPAPNAALRLDFPHLRKWDFDRSEADDMLVRVGHTGENMVALLQGRANGVLFGGGGPHIWDAALFGVAEQLGFVIVDVVAGEPVAFTPEWFIRDNQLARMKQTVLIAAPDRAEMILRNLQQR